MYVILFNDCAMLMCQWLFSTPTERMSSCFISGKWCRSDSASSSIPQGVCYTIWCLYNVDLTLPRHRRSNRRYIILFDPWTISIWLFLVITAPTEGILSRLKPGQFRSDSSSSAHSYRTYVILLNIIPGQCWYISLYRSPRTYVILFDFWTTGQCLSDSTSSSQLRQDVCFIA